MKLRDRVGEAAQPISPLKAVLTVLTAVIYAVAWIVGALWRGVSWSIGYLVTAAALGFRDAAGKGRP